MKKMLLVQLVIVGPKTRLSNSYAKEIVEFRLLMVFLFIAEPNREALELPCPLKHAGRAIERHVARIHYAST